MNGRVRSVSTLAVLVAAFLGAFAPAALADPSVVGGGPTTVSTVGFSPSVAMAANGSFAVAYSEQPSGGGNPDVLVRRFDAAAAGVGAPIPINDTADRRQEPSLGMAADGRMVLAYYREGPGFAGDVAVQRLAADGTPVGSEFTAHTATPGYQSAGRVAVAPDGRFVVVWQSNTGALIQARVFAADGTPQTGDIAVNQSTPATVPSVAIDAAGRFIVAWQRSIAPGETGSVPARRFGADGTPAGAEFAAYVGTANQNVVTPVVGLADDGRMIVVAPDAGGIRAQRRDAANAADGAAFTVNDSCPGCTFGSPRVAMDGDGDALIVWVTASSGGNFAMLKQYAGNGVQQGNQIVAGQGNINNLVNPVVALDGAARAAVAWEGVFVRRVDYATPPPPARTLTVTTSGTGAGTVTGAGIDCGGAGHADCSEVVADGAQITLTATPTGGSSFGGYSGGGCGAASPCTVTLDADKSVAAQFTAPVPGPGPGPDPAPPDPTPPDPDAPRVTKMTTAEQLVAGRPGVLAAQVTGSVDRLDWDLDGDGGTDVSCPGDQTTLRFRLPATKAPLRKAAFTGQVTARAVSRTGAASPFTQTFDVAPSPTAAKKLPAPVQKIANFIEKKPPVRACGREADLEQATAELTGNRSDPLELDRVFSRWPCTHKTLKYGPKFGSLLITGCFKRISTIGQVPEAERGWLTPMLDLAGLPKQFGTNSEAESNAIKVIEDALDFTDAWISEEPVLVNGIKVEPQGAGRIVVFPQVDRVYSSNAAVSVGGIKLEHSPKFSLNFGYGAGVAGPVTWDTFRRAPGGRRDVGGFPLTGDVRVVLAPGTSASEPPSAEIHTQLQLPNSLSFLPLIPGQRPPGKIKAEVTEKGELVFDDLTIGPIDASLGVASIADLTIKYVGGTEWRGTGKLCVVESVCLSAEEIPGDEPPGGVIFRDGELRYLYLTLAFPDPGITLYPGVQLNRIGAGFGLNPTRFLGGARFTAMEIFEIDGKVAMAFPSSAAPFKLTRGEMGNAFADNLYRDYTRFTLALAADAYLKLPIIDERIRLGGAYLLYNAPGYVAFGGGMDYDFLGILQVTGTTQGEFNFANGRFNLRGEVELCVVDIICRGSNVIVSSVGVGGCVNIDLWIGDINIGGGVRYDPFEVILWPFDGCKWSRFHDPNVFEAQAGGAGRPHNVQIKPGDPGRAIRLEGADGAPRVRVTAPDGQVHESPEEPVGGTSAIRFLRSEELKATVVGLQDPKPGKYTIEALPGSPAITKVSEAEDPPDAQISADVRDVGAASASDGGVRAAAVSSGRRTIKYNIRRRPDQLVTFVETGPEGSRPIGTATGGRGTLSFTPAPGRGKRKIEAQFELAGIRAETLTVATFTPPSPRLGRPARVRVSRRGTSLRVSWPRVAGATGYDVVTTLASGDQRKTRTRRNSITIARVIRSSGGSVAVRPTATLREGAARSARFRATARHTLKRFEPLLRFGRR